MQTKISLIDYSTGRFELNRDWLPCGDVSNGQSIDRINDASRFSPRAFVKTFFNVLPSYISSDKDCTKNRRAAVRARESTKRQTILLRKVQLLQFCTSPFEVAPRQGGDLAEIDLAVAPEPGDTLTVAIVDLIVPLPHRRPPGHPRRAAGWPWLNAHAVAGLLRPSLHRRRRALLVWPLTNTRRAWWGCYLCRLSGHATAPASP